MSYRLCKIEINHFTDDCEFLGQLRCAEYKEIISSEYFNIAKGILDIIKINKVFDIISVEVLENILKHYHYQICNYFSSHGLLIKNQEKDFKYSIIEIIEFFWKLSQVAVMECDKNIYIFHERVYVSSLREDEEAQILEFKLYFEEI